jgi:hypothetical protein
MNNEDLFHFSHIQKLKIRPTFGLAQGDLARYAQLKGWTRVGKGAGNRVLMGVIANGQVTKQE